MCGRFSIVSEREEIARHFGVTVSEAQWQPRYNAAPAQNLPVILDEDTGRVQWLRWGFIPFWAKDISIGSRFINARCETVREKKVYGEAFKKRRCLVVADGFYEWQAGASGKIPYRFELIDRRPFAFAGLWETWKAPDQTPLRSFTILTTEPNPLVAPVHDRMPVILLPEYEKDWIGKDVLAEDLCRKLFRPYPADSMRQYPISRKINSPKYDDPSVILPLTPKTDDFSDQL